MYKLFKFFYFPTDTAERLEEENNWKYIIDPLRDIFPVVEHREYEFGVRAYSCYNNSDYPLRSLTVEDRKSNIEYILYTFTAPSILIFRDQVMPRCLEFEWMTRLSRGYRNHTKEIYNFLYHNYVNTHSRYRRYSNEDYTF